MKTNWCDECVTASTDDCSNCITKFSPVTNNYTKPSNFTPLDKNVEKKEETFNIDYFIENEEKCLNFMKVLFGKNAVIDYCRCNSYSRRYHSAMSNSILDLKIAEWYERNLCQMMEDEL